MDRQEYRDIISAIKSNFKKKDYERVIMYARELPAKKVKENSVLEMIATSYEQLGKPNLARNTLEVAYKRMPGGKHTAYKLALISLKMKDVEGAIQYYEDFCKIAPNDNQRFLLKYEIAKVGKLSIYDRIRILEEYTSKETDDKWMYELARLYHEAGMGDKCAEMCDEIVIWFSDGDYLKRALELKFAHKALTPTQQAMYENIMQDYIEDYEEPEPPAPEVSPVSETEAEEFANDFLGDDEAKELYGDTKPLDIPVQGQSSPHTKKIGLSQPAGEEVRKTVSEIADSKKNIFYDFRIEGASLEASPGLNAWLNTLPDIKDEKLRQSMAKADDADEYVSEDEPVAEDIISGEAEEEPGSLKRPSYSPALESIRETPILENDFDHKKLEAGEGQLEVNFDLLNSTEEEIDGQMSIDQIFQTYANNIENNLENRAAVARIEAERLRQIKEAVESSMPASPVIDFDEDDEEETTQEESGNVPAYEEQTSPDDDADFTGLSEDLETERMPESADPVERILDDLVEREPERAFETVTEDAPVGDEDIKKGSTITGDIQIPAFLKDLKFSDEEDDETEIAADEEDFVADDAYIEEDDEEVLTMSTDDVFVDTGAADAETEDVYTTDGGAEEPDDIVEEQPKAEPEKIEKTEEEISGELDDLEDFLVEVMGKDKEDIDGLDEMGDDLAELFGGERAAAAEDAADEEPAGDAVVSDSDDAGIDVKAIEAEIAGVENIAEDDIEDAGDLEALIDEISSDDDVDDETEAETEEEIEEELEEEIEEVIDEIDDDDEEDIEEILDETEEEPADEISEGNEEDSVQDIEEATEAEPEKTEEAGEAAVETEDEAEIAEDAGDVSGEETEDTEETADAADADEDIEKIEETEDEDVEEPAEETAGEDLEDIIDEAEEEAANKNEEIIEDVTVETEEDVAADETPEEEETEDSDKEGEPAEETVGVDLEDIIDEAEEEVEKAADEEIIQENEETSDETKDEEDTENSEDDDYVEVKEENLGDTQSIDKVHKFSLDEETKEEIAEFLLIDGMREAVTKTVNDVIINKKAGDPTGGNLIVTGDTKSGKTFLAISIIKAVNKELQSGSGKVAKVQSEALNGKDITKVFKKIAGNDLIIENVGDLDDDTIDNIINAMNEGAFNDLLVFEGNMLAVETILNNHPEMEALFSNRIDISELSISQWADVACDYAKRKGYVVGDMALLALHAKIDEINLPTKRFGYEDVVNIMEAAIEHCDKRNTGKLFSAFSKKENEGIELNESDFA